MAGQYKSSDKLSYVIANDYRLLQVMSRFGISLGFGEKTITEVCRQCGVDAETFLTIINYVRQPSAARGTSECRFGARLSEANAYLFFRLSLSKYPFPSAQCHRLLGAERDSLSGAEVLR